MWTSISCLPPFGLDDPSDDRPIRGRSPGPAPAEAGRGVYERCDANLWKGRADNLFAGVAGAEIFDCAVEVDVAGRIGCNR